MPEFDPDSKKLNRKPRVRSFLQKASAIIASEKGLNATAQQKLQTLAEHLKMPQEEFQEALAELQANEQITVGLNRYEKEFLDFLQFEFEQLNSGIVTVAMEDKAVDLAARKYDIQEARARRLIHEKAESMEIRRISKSDAEAYVEKLIASRIGDANRIEEPARERFYQIAKKWGVDNEHVDAIVLQALSANRRLELEQQGVTRRPWVVGALLILLLAAGIVLAINARQWWSSGRAQKDPNPVKKDDVLPDDASKKIPDWWKDAGLEAADEHFSKMTVAADWFRLLASENVDERTSGLAQAIDGVRNLPRDDRPKWQAFLANYYFCCPDSNFSNHVLQELKQRLSLPPSRLPIPIARMKSGYEANQILGYLLRFRPMGKAIDVDERKSWIEQSIFREFGTIPESEGMQEYLERTNRVLAINQWNHLLQTSWASPQRTSLLIGPLYELTQGKLKELELQRLHRRTVMSVLESDQDLWSGLKDEISKAISTAPPDALNTWINHFQTVSDQGYQDWLGLKLVAKCQLELVTPSRVEVADALKQFKTQSRREQFRELLIRDEKLDLLQQEVRNSFRTSGASPQLIADVSRVVTLSMYLSPTDQSSFQYDRFDLLYRRGSPNLGKLARTSINEQDNFPGVATQSDFGQKQKTLEKLASLPRDQKEARLTSLNRLADVAGRFPDIPYSEAQALAGYYLRITNDRERIQAEKLLPTFVQWPSFGLAIADQFADPKTTLDQALTIAQFYSEDSFELKEATFWREETRKFIFDAVIENLDRGSFEVTDSSQQWYFLRTNYAQLGELRLDALGMNRIDYSRNRSVASTRLMIETLLKRIPGGVEYPVERAIEVLKKQSNSELEEVVSLNKVLIKLLARYVSLRWPDRADEVNRIAGSLPPSGQMTSGEMLLSTEFVLLELWSIERKAVINRLLTR